jgi:hypothetical protein
MRDIEVIDGELRLLLAIRQTVDEEEGRPPSTRHIEALLDGRYTATFSRTGSRNRICSTHV